MHACMSALHIQGNLKPREVCGFSFCIPMRAVVSYVLASIWPLVCNLVYLVQSKSSIESGIHTPPTPKVGSELDPTGCTGQLVAKIISCLLGFLRPARSQSTQIRL